MAVSTVRLERPPARTLHPLHGFGAQFNTNIFTREGQAQALSEQQLRTLREAIANLKPGHSRIFVRKVLRPDTPNGKNAPEFVALMKTIELAQEAGANVNLTWWHGPYADRPKLRQLAWPNRNVRDWPNPSLRKWPEALTDATGIRMPRVLMHRFALIIEEARRRGFDCVTHATIQNEVNGEAADIAQQNDPHLSMRFYELLYRFFDESLRGLRDPLNPSRSLRESIEIVAGDLLERKNVPRNHQDAWIKYMHANMELPREGMPSVLDAYSIHLYWEPDGGPEGFPQKPEKRLSRLQALMADLKSDKPVYVTEYGVRKRKARPRPGVHGGVRIECSPQCAFQHAWFNALAPQFGCVGLAKWALYRTDKAAGWGHWGMIDAPSGNFERFPVYRVTRLFSHLVGPGWTAAGLGRSSGADVLVSKFAGPGGQDESVIVLNGSSRPQQVRVEGLKRGRSYQAVDWNRAGNGELQPHPVSPVVADSGGTATVTVPHHAAVALSTRPLGL